VNHLPRRQISQASRQRPWPAAGHGRVRDDFRRSLPTWAPGSRRRTVSRPRLRGPVWGRRRDRGAMICASGHQP
jgi:hypothetical protein